MINLTIHTQPDDESCGPTSLHAIYNYYGLNVDLKKLISTVERSPSGGTIAPMLGMHALTHGFQTTIYINNLDIFDPTWFDHTNGSVCPQKLTTKLTTQLRFKKTKNIKSATKAYLNYLHLGGEVRFCILNAHLLKKYFAQNIPILAGLSATYLYKSSRERYINGEAIFDDIRGTTCGHFVVLCGYDGNSRLVTVADPHRANPISQDNYYKVNSRHLINAIMVGVLTHDANLIIIQPLRAVPSKYPGQY